MHFKELHVLQGFDSLVNPAYQMVPVLKSRTVLLRAGAGAQVISVFPGIATIHETPLHHPFLRQFTITGRMAGTTFVEAWEKGGCARLEVSVKEEVVVKTAFTRLRDAANQETTVTESDIERCVKAANSILQPQANVRIKKQSIRTITVPRDLGGVMQLRRGAETVAPVTGPIKVATRQVDAAVRKNKYLKVLGFYTEPAKMLTEAFCDVLEDDWHAIAECADKSAQLNIFFGWRPLLWREGKTEWLDGFSNRATGIAVIDDRCVTPIHIVMTHEIVHLLDSAKTNRHPLESSLMYGGGYSTGIVLTKEYIEAINTSSKPRKK